MLHMDGKGYRYKMMRRTKASAGGARCDDEV